MENRILENRGTLNTWLLAGLATGALAYYLFGTRNGKELVNTIVDTTRDVSEDVRENVKSQYNKLSQKARKLADQESSTF